MSGFNGNERLQDHTMYALDWAIFLRHNIEDQLIPFLFEWKEEEIFKSMLQPGGDPEEFAYRLAGKSERGGDQFVIGYEGMLTDQEGNKQDAFIIKGYDRTQDKGVFIAQIFEPKEKNGTFNLIEKPMLIGNPDLPFAIDANIKPAYETEELYQSGMVLNNGDQVAILSHHNPSVVSSGIKNYLRHKITNEDPNKLSGNFEMSIAPQEHAGDFFKYTVLRTIAEEKASDLLNNWEKHTGKPISITCKYGDEQWLGAAPQETDNLQQSQSSAEPELSDEEKLTQKYRQLNRNALDAEYRRIISIPGARTNIKCLTEMASLMGVYEGKGWEMPDERKKNSAKGSSKSGCASIMFLLMILLVAVKVIPLLN